MKQIILLLLLLTLLGCRAEKTEIQLPETEVTGAPLAEPETDGAPKPETPEEPDTAETIQVEFAAEGASIVLHLPADWAYETDAITEDAWAMGISFRPADETEGWLRLQYYPSGFGVCGTGLEEEAYTFSNGQTASIGYYDGRDVWSFLAFRSEDHSYALTVDGADWIPDYEQQIFELLETAQLG